MTVPEFNRSPDAIIAPDTFTRLRDAARDLFRFGPDADARVFGDITLEENMMAEFKERDLAEGSTHTSSGTILGYKGPIRSYRVWKMFEGSRILTATVMGDRTITPVTIVRRDLACAKRIHSRRDYILTSDELAFSLYATEPPYDFAEEVAELNERSALSLADELERAVQDAPDLEL